MPDALSASVSCIVAALVNKIYRSSKAFYYNKTTQVQSIEAIYTNR
jgi:hypothetical protein